MFKSKLFSYIDKADHSEKMTPEMIKRIVGGKESLYALSKELGCSYSYLRLIKQGKIYKAQVAEALKELGLESAEIHSHDTKLPSEHKAPTANTPQSEVDLTTYENPNNILQLLKATPKYANLDAWHDWLNKHYGDYRGRGRSRYFEKPETYVPTAVKINSKALKDGRLTLNLLITYVSHSIDEKTYQKTHFLVKGEFIVASIKGKPSISQKGKLELNGLGADTIDSHFKTDAENEDIQKQSNENQEANKVLAEHFLKQHEGEYKAMMESVVKNSRYEIKGFKLEHRYEGRYRLDIEFAQDSDYQTDLSPRVKITYDDGKTAEVRLAECFRHEGNFFYGSAKTLTRKIKSIALDKPGTLENLKSCFNRITESASRQNKITEKADNNLIKELNEAYHHFISQAHWTALKLKVTDESTRFRFVVQCAIDGERLNDLLSKGDYNKLINSAYDHFYLGIKDGKVQFTEGSGNGRTFTAKECLEFLDNIDRLASNNLKKAAKGKEMVGHEASDMLAKVEAVVAPLKHFDFVKLETNLVDAWNNADKKRIFVKARRTDIYDGKFIDWEINVLPGLSKPIFEFVNATYRESAKKKTKEQILEYMRETVHTVVTNFSKK